MTDLSVAAAKAATKSIRVVDKTFTIQGVAPEDRYFKQLVDGYDPDFERICRMFISPEHTCVDIGANIGMTALMMSRFARRIVAVEGGPLIAKVLAGNCRNEPNIDTEHCAVGDHDGEVCFFENSAYGGIQANGGATVPVKRLATILAEHDVKRLDFLKIDVEGSEWAILRDAIDIINKHRTLVLFEYNTYAQLYERGTDPVGFAKWIATQFAHVYLVRRHGGALMRIRGGEDGAWDIVHTNIVSDGGLNDILATNAPERFGCRLAEIEAQASRTHYAETEVDRLRGEIAALRASTCWRVTAPLRWLRRLCY
jgi:FkbM family methyltransferase